VLVSAFKYANQSKVANIAETCFSLWLVTQMRGNDAARWEQFFKFLIQKGFKRHPWNFDHMLDQARNVLAPAEFEYADALAAAFLDECKVADLERFVRWRNLKPLDPRTESPGHGR